MKARKGDHVVIDGTKVGQARRSGEVVRVEGPEDHSRLWVRWDDGHETLLMPGPGVRVERTPSPR
jgi:hypothetical protein